MAIFLLFPLTKENPDNPVLILHIQKATNSAIFLLPSSKSQPLKRKEKKGLSCCQLFHS